MKKFTKSIRSGLSERYIVVVAAVTLFFVFYLIFTSTTEGSFFQNLIAAFIGTIITVAITAYLLSAQAKADELKDTQVEVFKRKVDRYEKVTDVLANIFADKKIDKDEAKELGRAIHNMALFCSKESLIRTISFIRQNTIGDSDEISLMEVIAEYRKDLKLEDLDEFTADEIKPITNLISQNFENLEQYRTIYQFVTALINEISNTNIEAEDNTLECFLPDGIMETISFDIQPIGTDRNYSVQMEYPEGIINKEDDLTVELYLQSVDEESLLKVKQELSAIQFEFNEYDEEDDKRKDEEDNPSCDISKKYKLRINVTDKRKLVILSKPQTIAKKIVNDLLSVERIVFNSKQLA